MNRLLLSLCFAAASAWAGQLNGFISDATCGAGNAKGTKETQECARTCVKNGAAPVFVMNDKVYKISDPKKVMALVGDKVVVDGTLKGDTIEIASIKAAQ